MTFGVEASGKATTPATLEVDRDGLIIDLNPAACSLLDCRRGDVIGQNWIDAFAPCDRAGEFKRYFDGLMVSGARYDALPEIDELRASGDHRLAVSCHTTLIHDRDDRLSGVLYEFEPNPSIEDRIDRLEEFRLLYAVGRLTAGIAHDFGDVLQIIRGNVELLSVADDVDDELIAAVLAATDRGAELVRRMMAALYQKSLLSDRLDVGVSVDNVITLVRRTFPKNIRIVADIAADAPSVIANEGKLECALLNIMINARDAMPDGGALTITCRNVVIADDETRARSGSRAGRYVWIAVADTGQGVPPQVLPRIFERYFTTKERGEGTGLGLASVSEFAKQFGGFVNAASSRGGGLTLNIFLPAAEAEAEGRVLAATA